MGSAAERIVLDDAVLSKQVQALKAAASVLGSQVGPAQTRLASTSFGAMNSFLVPVMNGMAGRTAQIVDMAKQVSERMEAGVAATRSSFEALEEDYQQTFAALAEGDE
jgi:hypothetical protein